MKIIIAFLLLIQYSFSQTRTEDKFTFEGQDIKYVFYNSIEKIYPVNKFYVFVNQNESIIKCLDDKYTRPYFFNMPTYISKEKQDKLFLAFVSHITERTKLIESQFYIISDKDYTNIYKELFEREHRDNKSSMNKITALYINPSTEEICKMF